MNNYRKAMHIELDYFNQYNFNEKSQKDKEMLILMG